MAKRSSSPPLYELIRSRGTERESPPAAAPPPRVSGREMHHGAGGGWASLPGSWLRPGRILHVPIGYLFVGAALVIVVMAASYMIGHKRGEARNRFVRADDAALVAGGSEAVPRDPLAPVSQREPEGTRPHIANRQRPEPRGQREWGPVFSDPRESGQWYLFLMTTNRSGAERFAEFARDRGLETYIISANNRLFRVFALPGFESHSSPEAQAFREEILNLGRVWREQTRERVNPVEMSEWSLYGPRR